MRMRRSGWRGAAPLAACGLAWLLAAGSLAHAQNTIGGDVFAPGQADFTQSGSQVGRGPGFQFSDAFYAANGVNAQDIRNQERGATAPSRFGAFYRGPGDAFVASGTAPDSRFRNNTRIRLHDMGFNAAGEMLFLPDFPALFFESAFTDPNAQGGADFSFVFFFPRTRDYASQVPGCNGARTSFDLLDYTACNRRQPPVFDTGNGYLTFNPLQLWRFLFVTWDGPDVNTPQCQAKMAELAARNGRDTDGTPILTRIREIADVSGPDVIAGQGANETVLPFENFLGTGLPNPDPRNDIPGVAPQPGGQVCVTVRSRRHVDSLGNPARPDDPLTAKNEALDGPPYVACPLLIDPRGGSVTADAVALPAVDDDILKNFQCLRQTGELCNVPTLALTPFVQALPIPPDADQVVRVSSLVPAVDPNDNCKAEVRPASDPNDGCNLYPGEPGANRPPDRAIQKFAQFPPVKLYEMYARSFQHLFHPELQQTSTIWGYGNKAGQTWSPGPTFREQYGSPILVRIHNNLPAGFPGNDGFGIPQISTHLHNFHSAPESDGGPLMFFDRGRYMDHHYAMSPAGGDPREVLGQLWYHDHRADFTSQNTYKGLVGNFLAFDQLDSNNETDSRPGAFRLPSGSHDVVLAVSDKKFDPITHKLVFDPFNLDGFLGDQVVVNGAVMPYMNVEQRKYRFRIVDNGPSRIYTFKTCLVGSDGRECASDNTATNITLIGNDGNLLNKPLTVSTLTIAPAERNDVVIDFSQFRNGDRINLMDIADQTSGKGRTGVFLPMTSDFALKVMQFRVVTGPVADPSRIPAVMRQKPTIPNSEIACERTFTFDNQGGGWVVNGQLFNFLPRFQVQQGTAERWTLVNASRDWEHPIHIHLEEHQFEVKDGATPPDFEQMRKDVALLRPGDSITLTMRHRDWLNEYPLHCHNTVHEDHAMMLLWEVVNHAVPCVAEP